MSVENTQVIDFIGFEEATGKVVLTIADHLPWDDRDHLLLLQEKLNSYLAFIESGEIYESYPRAMGRQLVIDLVVQHWPSVEGLRHLELAKKQVEGVGNELRYRTLEADADT
jgi:hypothetical protein